MDPLTVLRLYFQEGKESQIVNDKLVFGKHRFPLNTPTTFTTSKGVVLTIFEAWLFSKYHNSTSSEYLNKCKNAGVHFVGYVDKKKLLDLLNTKLDISLSDAKESLLTKRQLSNAYGPPSKRSASAPKLSELTMTDELIKAKEDFARALDERVEDPTSVLEMESNAFVAAEKKITERIKARERKPVSRDAILQAQKNFTYTLKISDELEKAKKRRKEEEEQGKDKYDRYNAEENAILESDAIKIDTHGSIFARPTGSKPSSSSSTPSSSSSSSSRRNIPIILVPNSVTSVITLENALEFLTSGILHATSAKRKVTSNSKAKSFSRVISNGSKVRFDVVDNPAKLSSNDWKRVVAVFVLGATWQFASWPEPYKNPINIFSNMKGFYFTEEGKEVPAIVKQWDVRVMKVALAKPHTVQKAQVEFWDAVDRFTAAKLHIKKPTA